MFAVGFAFCFVEYNEFKEDVKKLDNDGGVSMLCSPWREVARVESKWTESLKNLNRFPRAPRKV